MIKVWLLVLFIVNADGDYIHRTSFPAEFYDKAQCELQGNLVTGRYPIVGFKCTEIER